jgi:hypothetical protein
MTEEGSTRDEREVLEDRLRWAAESLTIEFQGISQADAERLVFDVAEQFLSDAKVAQFVPTFATRRARQVLRSGQLGSMALARMQPHADLEVIVEDDPIEVETSHLATVGQAISPGAPLRPPAYYATEARRLLEKAKVLRANAVVPGGRAD